MVNLKQEEEEEEGGDILYMQLCLHSELELDFDKEESRRGNFKYYWVRVLVH